MLSAIFGLVGVIVGAGITWLKEIWTTRRATAKNARYLAIRVVCVLDKYMTNCIEVVRDNGRSFGQRGDDGYAKPQFEAPGPPIYPNDIDWKSIDHELMYRLLSLPSEVEEADVIIKMTEDIAAPPDYEDWFEERRYHYSKFGLVACRLSEELSDKYSIKKKTYVNWNPAEDFANQFHDAAEKRNRRLHQQAQFVNRVQEAMLRR